MEEKKLWDVQQQIKSEAGDNEINIKLDSYQSLSLVPNLLFEK